MGIVHSVNEEHVHDTNPLVSLVYLISGILALLLALRFLFILFGAHNTGFVNFVMRVTQPFVQSFYGILGQNFPYLGVRIEIESLIALLLIWLVASIIVAVFRQVH
jgi:hypothetical protein